MKKVIGPGRSGGGVTNEFSDLELKPKKRGDDTKRYRTACLNLKHEFMGDIPVLTALEGREGAHLELGSITGRMQLRSAGNPILKTMGQAIEEPLGLAGENVLDGDSWELVKEFPYKIYETPYAVAFAFLVKVDTKATLTILNAYGDPIFKQKMNLIASDRGSYFIPTLEVDELLRFDPEPYTFRIDAEKGHGFMGVDFPMSMVRLVDIVDSPVATIEDIRDISEPKTSEKLLTIENNEIIAYNHWEDQTGQQFIKIPEILRQQDVFSISPNVFTAQAWNPRLVYIHDRIYRIGEGNFLEGSHIIIGREGSEAQAYAIRNGLQFESNGQVPINKKEHELGSLTVVNNQRVWVKKVDAVEGKQLSTEDFTTEFKEKLSNMTSHFRGAKKTIQEINTITNPVHGDWCVLLGETNFVYFFDDDSVTWINTGASLGGDMLSALYDPQHKSVDVYHRQNHDGEQGIETITSLGETLDGKLNIRDIVANLQTEDHNKALSASMGVAIKAFMDEQTSLVQSLIEEVSNSKSKINDLQTIIERILAGEMRIDWGTLDQLNGYTYLPNGLLLQWGVVEFNVGHDNKTLEVNFNKPFEKQCYVVDATPIAKTSQGSGGDTCSAEVIDKTKFYLVKDYATTSNSENVQWFAIGR